MFRNRLSYFRQHKLINVQHITKNGLPSITGITLTERGKIALGWIKGELNEPEQKKVENKKENSNGINESNQTQQIKIASELMTKLSQDNPNRKITFDITGGTISIQ